MKTQQHLRRPASRHASKKNLFSRFSLLLILLLAVLPPAAFSAEKTKKAEARQSKIIFLPFAVKTQPPQDHLRSGLTNILATRLSGRTGLTAIYGTDKTSGLEDMLQKGDRQEIKKILKTMQGDWLLIGSLEQQKDGYEILIHIFGSGRMLPASFTRTIAALDKTLPALDELSGEIADKVFSQKPPEEESAAAPAKEGVSGFQTVHPDKAWRDALSSSAGMPPGMTGDAFQVLAASSSGELSASFLAMDAGDLDGDGQEELVLLEQGRLVLCRFGGDGFRQIAELPLPSYLGLHTVHLADLDGSKGMEIYVSASSGDSPSSQVLQWDGRSFHILDEYVPCYLRTDTDSAGKPVLLGQAGGGVFRMTVSPTGKVAQAEEISVPRGFGLYDFIRTDLDQDGRREFIGLTEDNRLLIMDQDEKPLWKSEESYGAGRDALGTLISRRQAEIDHPGERERSYLHARIIAQDVNGDGKPEIIVSRNRVTNVKFLKNLRYFEGSSIAALSWDGNRMNQLWETKKLPGYTADYQVLRNADQPGRLRLFSVESDDSGNPLYFWTKEKSVIRMQELIGTVAPVVKH